MIYCIVITFIATFIVTWFLIGIITLSSGWGALKAGALSAISQLTEFIVITLIVIALVALAALVYFLIKSAKQSFDEAAENQRQERIAQLDNFIQEKQQQAQEAQAKLNYYQSELNQISNLQDKINAILKDLLSNSYNFIASKENLIEALRERKSKDIDIALSRNTISKKGAERAKRQFEKLIDEVENTIIQEKQVLMLIAGNIHDTIEQLIKQITSEVKK